MTQAIAAIQSGVAVTSTILNEVDGLDKVFKCAKSALDLLAACFSPLSEGLVDLGNCFKTCTDIMSPFQLFKVVKEWFDVPNKNWAGTTTLVCVTALSTIGVGKFLEKMKLFNMTAAVSKIGTIPVLGAIIEVPMGVLALGVSFFNIIDTGIKITHKVDPRIDDKSNPTINEKSLEGFERSKRLYHKWVARKQAFQQNQGAAAGVGFDDNVTKAWKKTFQSFEQGAKVDQQGARDYLDFKVRKWKAIMNNSKVENTKSALSIISDISKIVAISLGMVGTYFAVAAFTGATLTMLTLGLVVTGIALGKKIYETSHPKVAVPHEPVNVALFRARWFTSPSPVNLT